MRLISFKDNELKISDEAYHIKVFKDLWDKNPTKAEQIFGFLYFFYHPSSDYNYLIDEDEKKDEILESNGIKDTSFFKDKLYLKAVEVYKKTIITTSSRVLDNNRKRLQKLDDFLNNMVIDEDNVAKYTKAISDSIKIGVEVSNAEKEVVKDVEEQSIRVRGKASLTIGDMGI